MSLASGGRFGPYEVIALIGAGGLGEVYRARDTKLDRHIAIKVLPDVVATDSERVARFEREARTLASLNHPNIAHIYDAGHTGGVAFLAMELVDGLTLAELIDAAVDHAPSGTVEAPVTVILNWRGKR